MKSRHIILAIVIVIIIGLILVLQNRGRFLGGGESLDLGPLTDLVVGEVGLEAQDFVLLDYNDTSRQLSNYRGTPIVLNFWATWCPFCIDELPDFQEAYAELGQNGAAFKIIAVNRGESVEQAKSFTDPMSLTFDLLLNRADDVARAYNLRAMPSTYFIDANGVIVDIKRGPMDAEEVKARVINNFNLGEEMPVIEKEVEALPPDLPETLMNSTRSISITDGVKHSVPLNAILSGGPPQDGIPSIDNPKFVSVEQANEFLNDEGLGIAVSFNGIDRFYPNQITVWHEIVNDQIGDQPLLVTYCPLCGTGVVFNPIVNGKTTEFGTSGKLWNSNLVMYDRQTNSFWSQVLGESIVGEQTGTKLELLPHENVLYKDWKAKHPNGEVLSRETGHFRNYNQTPYGEYDNNLSVFFPVDHEDDTFHPKTPTYQIEVKGQTKIYPIEELEKGPASFEDELAGIALAITYDQSDKTVDIREKVSGKEVVPFYGFWFSVIAVHPDAEIYQFGK